jgi:hypothetical protein
MKRASAMVAGLLLSAAAQADWVPYGESGASAAYYFDRDTVRVIGEKRRVWRLFAFKVAREDGVRSGKALIEIHCGNHTYRYLRTMYYSGEMGQGKYLGGTGEHKPEHIGPDTMIAALAQQVCGPATAAVARQKRAR